VYEKGKDLAAYQGKESAFQRMPEDHLSCVGLIGTNRRVGSGRLLMQGRIGKQVDGLKKKKNKFPCREKSDVELVSDEERGLWPAYGSGGF